MDASPSRSAAVVMAAALLGPLVACAALTTVRDDVANANAALGLVLIVVGVASTGRRVGAWRSPRSRCGDDASRLAPASGRATSTAAATSAEPAASTPSCTATAP